MGEFLNVDCFIYYLSFAYIAVESGGSLWSLLCASSL